MELKSLDKKSQGNGKSYSSCLVLNPNFDFSYKSAILKSKGSTLTQPCKEIIHVHLIVGSKLLVVQRAEQEGKWQTPSEGRKKIDVSLQETAQRCCWEELLIWIQIASILSADYGFYGLTPNSGSLFYCTVFYAFLKPAKVSEIKLNRKELCDYKIMEMNAAQQFLSLYGYPEAVRGLKAVRKQIYI